MSNPFNILFEPIQIGPVTAPNRFFQVPHCNGMGYRFPRSLAAMRGIKAEGGWGVVCTEELEIHHTSDLTPFIEGRLWDDKDIPALRLMVEAVHQHGALAGTQITHNGNNATNQYSRATSLGLRSQGLSGITPGQTRRMDKEDIRNLRRWHREAALRAKKAGFDIIYVYAAHNLPLTMRFLLSRYNDRTDEYGGSLENRVRFLRELIEEAKEAVGDQCAVAVRLAVDELLGDEGLTHQGEAHDIVAMLAELPDLWDVNISDWPNDSATSRFKKEGFQEPYIAFVKKLTSKPVVGVGRYTSPDAMVSAIRRGIVDLIGAARPSIADPFMPRKIKEACIEDVRECIGCNICITGDMHFFPIRCTQNPTMGEEWRRGWHPEVIAPKKDDRSILVVGGGPAGLECARALGQRGYTVTLVEARRELGGRVALEARLPGLSEWRRVVDWRITQLEKLPDVSVYPGSLMAAKDVLEAGFKHVIVATGAHWRRDGVGRHALQPIAGYEQPHVFTPDDLLAGKLPQGKVLVYDDDHYYMGSVLANLLVKEGCTVTLATPSELIAPWTVYTLEQEHIEQELRGNGVRLITRHTLKDIQPQAVMLAHVLADDEQALACDGLVLLADRLPDDTLYQALKPALAEKKLESLQVIGDAEAPHLIARAIFSGYRAAVEFGDPPQEGTPFLVERMAI